MLSLDPATRRGSGLQPHLAGRRDLPGQRAHRSSASARVPDAGRGACGGAPSRTAQRSRSPARRSANRRSDPSRSCTDRRRRRTRCRRSGHHTFDSTHIAMGVLTAGVERGAFAGRVVGLSRRRTGRKSLGSDGSRRARLMVDPRLVPAVAGVDVPAVARLPHSPGSAGRRRRPANDGVGIVESGARRGRDVLHGRVGPEPENRRLLRCAILPS